MAVEHTDQALAHRAGGAEHADVEKQAHDVSG